MSNEVTIRVAKCIAEVLALTEEEITPRSRLTNDLGADSLDLVDLMYTLEEEFGISLDQRDLSITLQLGLSEEEIEKDGVLTEQALTRLREHFPWAGDVLVDSATRDELADLLTVEEVARSVGRKLETSSTD